MTTGLPGFSSLGVEPVAQHLTGLRYWRLVCRGVRAPTVGPIGPALKQADVFGSLCSMHMSQYRWGADVNTATCLRTRVASPRHVHMIQQRVDRLNAVHETDPMPVDCGCGFWAYASNNGHQNYDQPAALVGIVHAWGRLIVGPKGFRAQHARIVALATTAKFAQPIDAAWEANGPTLVDALARTRRLYPGVAWFDTADELIDTYPPTDLRPFMAAHDDGSTTTEEQPA